MKLPLARAPLSMLVASALSLAACGGNSDPAALPTLDGSVPLVIGHRGLPGLYPEETLPSYEGAADGRGSSDDSVESPPQLKRYQRADHDGAAERLQRRDQLAWRVRKRD